MAPYSLIDPTKLMVLLGMRDPDAFAEHHQQWIDEALKRKWNLCRADQRTIGISSERKNNRRTRRDA